MLKHNLAKDRNVWGAGFWLVNSFSVFFPTIECHTTYNHKIFFIYKKKILACRGKELLSGSLGQTSFRSG